MRDIQVREHTNEKLHTKAVEVSAPGELRVVERQVAELGQGQVRIRVEACGNLSHRCGTIDGVNPV